MKKISNINDIFFQKHCETKDVLLLGGTLDSNINS